MSQSSANCSVCGTSFVVRFSYQSQQTSAGPVTYCSQSCHERALFAQTPKQCSVCAQSFELRFAYQQAFVGGQQSYYCSLHCRDKPVRQEVRRRRGAHKIAVMNQKGGTGKTTTTVSLGHGLARLGHKVLIIDMDSQGNVGVCLGQGEGKNLYHVLVEDADPQEAIVEVRENLDLLPSDSLLAKVEVHLAHTQHPARSMKAKLKHLEGYDFILLDCGPSLSLVNHNALFFADYVIIPVACDYLSLVGVKQILKTLRGVQERLRHPITVMGVVPTFYDVRNRISHEVLRTLRRYFTDKVLTPIRINTRLKEAPAKQKTIFEYAPRSAGAEDYGQMVSTVIEILERAPRRGANVSPPAFHLDGT